MNQYNVVFGTEHWHDWTIVEANGFKIIGENEYGLTIDFLNSDKFVIGKMISVLGIIPYSIRHVPAR